MTATFHSPPSLSLTCSRTRMENPSVAEEINALREFLTQSLNEPLEKLRQNKTIGQSLDAKAVITGSSKDPIIPLLKKYEADLPELLFYRRSRCISKKTQKPPRSTLITPMVSAVRAAGDGFLNSSTQTNGEKYPHVAPKHCKKTNSNYITLKKLYPMSPKKKNCDKKDCP